MSLQRGHDPRDQQGDTTSFLHALKSLKGEFGLPLALLYGAHRALQKLSGGRSRIVPYGMYAQPIGTGGLTTVRADPSTLVEEVHPGCESRLNNYRPASVVAARWHAGSRCFLATCKGAFAGTIWCSHGHHDEDEVYCRWELVDPVRSVWDFDVYVEPRLRMGRTLARMWKAVDAQLASEGVEWSFSRISLFNRPSVSTHQRLGAVRIGTAVFVVLGPLQLAWAQGRLHVTRSVRSGQMPVVRLAPP